MQCRRGLAAQLVPSCVCGWWLWKRHTFWECGEGPYKGDVIQASCVEWWVQHVRMGSEKTNFQSLLSPIWGWPYQGISPLCVSGCPAGVGVYQIFKFFCKVLDSGIPWTLLLIQSLWLWFHQKLFVKNRPSCGRCQWETPSQTEGAGSRKEP